MAALRQDKTHYTLDAGLPELLSALVRYYGKFSGRRLVEENLLETTGAGEAIFLAVTSLAAPGRGGDRHRAQLRALPAAGSGWPEAASGGSSPLPRRAIRWIPRK